MCVLPFKKLANLQPVPSFNTKPIKAAKAKGIGINILIGENQQSEL